MTEIPKSPPWLVKSSPQGKLTPNGCIQLTGLHGANRAVAPILNARPPVTQATLDVDATIVTSEKKEEAHPSTA